MLTNTVAKVSNVTAIQPWSCIDDSTNMGKFAKRSKQTMTAMIPISTLIKNIIVTTKE